MIEPFMAQIPRGDLDDLQQRLSRTRWAPETPAGRDEGAYGVPNSRLQRLVAGWREFDWRRQEDRLNAYPQFRTVIDGQPVHFLHVRSAAPDRPRRTHCRSCSATAGPDRSSSTSSWSTGSPARRPTEVGPAMPSTWYCRRCRDTAFPVPRSRRAGGPGGSPLPGPS